MLLPAWGWDDVAAQNGLQAMARNYGTSTVPSQSAWLRSCTCRMRLLAGRAVHIASTPGPRGRRHMELLLITTMLALSFGLGLASAHAMLSIVFFFMAR